MFVCKTKEKILKLEEQLKAEHISLWSTLQGAKSYYDKQDGLYAAYKQENPTYAKATPVKVYRLN